MRADSKKKSRRVPGPERREQILGSACELFHKYGYDAGTTKQLAERVGCNEALLFRHFTSKDAIYRALMEEWEQGMSEPVEVEVVFGSALKTLEKMYNEIIITREWNKNKQGRQHLESAILSRTGMSELHNKILRESQDVVKTVIVPLIEKGQNDGEIRKGNPSELAQMFWSLVAGSWYLNKYFAGMYPKLPFSSVVHILK